ncbi:MAG: hypothetical protein ABIQ01_13480 [Pseudolysinimonas sp.]
MLYVAAALMAILAVGHSIIGERKLIGPLAHRDDLPRLFGGTRFSAATLRFAWHVTSVLGLGFAAVLLAFALGASGDVIVSVIGWTLIVSGLLPLIATRGRHLAWVVFFAAGALCLLSVVL